MHLHSTISGFRGSKSRPSIRTRHLPCPTSYHSSERFVATYCPSRDLFSRHLIKHLDVKVSGIPVWLIARHQDRGVVRAMRRKTVQTLKQTWTQPRNAQLRRPTNQPPTKQPIGRSIDQLKNSIPEDTSTLSTQNIPDKSLLEPCACILRLDWMKSDVRT